MKIICDSKDEMIQLLEACRIIHDFTVYVGNLSKKEKRKISIDDGIVNERFSKYFKSKEFSVFKDIGTDDVIGICLPLEKNKVLNLLAGLYDTDDDRIRTKYIKVKK